MKKLCWMVLALALATLGPAQAGDGARPGATKTITLPPEKTDLKTGPGLQRVQANCLVCHSLDYIAMQPKGTKAQWAAEVTKMIRVYGAAINNEDAGIIAAYLAENYGTGN